MKELAEYADKLTLRDEQGELSQVGFLPDFSRSHTDLYVQMLGGSWYNENGSELTVNSQPMIDAENWQQCHRNSPPENEKIPDLGFYSGKVAMMVDGEWQVGPNYISHFQPELNYGVAPC